MWTGAEIRRRRNDRNLTQRQLADAIGASRRAVASWEADESSPQGRFVNAMERVLAEPSTPEPEPDGGPLLAEADFTQVLNRLIDLHNEALRGGLNRVLRVEDVQLPNDLPEHGVTQGPPLTSERRDRPAEDRPSQSSDRVNSDGVDHTDSVAE